MSKPISKTRPKFINHRDIARMIGVDTGLLRRWVAVGDFPEPVAIIRATWLYRLDVIEHWTETGEWPDTAKFKRGTGNGRIFPPTSR